MNLGNAVKHINFLRQKPLVSLKIAKGVFCGAILCRPVLRTVDFAVTNLCNSKCKMCSAHLLYKRPDKRLLSPDEIVDAFLQASRLGAMHINFTGGEPLMRDIEELCYIIRRIRPKHHLISLVTNSLLVTKTKLEKLKSAGLDTLQISMESLDPKTNDEIRGVPGHLAKALQAYDLAAELGLSVCLSTVVTHKNFDEVEKIIAFARKQGKKDLFVLLNPISASGVVVGQTQLKLTEQDLEKYEKLLSISFVRADTIFNFDGRSGCPGGKERIHITAFGDVITCPHVQISYGNIRLEPLAKIWGRMLNTPDLKKFSKVCKHAFDQEYYDKFLLPIEDHGEVPILLSEHPAAKGFSKTNLF